MGSMMGVHWIPQHRGMFNGFTDAGHFAMWDPAWVKIVTVDEHVPYLEDVPPAATIVVRNYPMSEMYHDRGFGPGRAAPGRYAPARQSGTPDAVGEAHAVVCSRMAYNCQVEGVPKERLVFEGLNEPMLWSVEPPHLTARYYAAFLDGLHAHGLRGVCGNLGVGWPGNGGPGQAPEWGPFEPMIEAMVPGDYLGLHEYWHLNGPAQNWTWWAGRFTQCPYRVPILITECGIDTGVAGQAYGGWRDLPGRDEPSRARRYVDELIWYARQGLEDGRVKGILPFTWDIGSATWEKFDIRNGSWWDAWCARCCEIPAPGPGAEPPPQVGVHLPEDEPVMPVWELADKVRWWKEEEIRAREVGDAARADAISYSLVRLGGVGLMYRLENALKSGQAQG